MTWTVEPETMEEKIEIARSTAFMCSELELSEPLEIKLTPKLEKLSDQRLCDALESRVEKMKKARLETSMEKLTDLRRPYFLIAIELNVRGRIAPAFRPVLRPYRPNVRMVIDDLHSLDLQVIDLHWLKCRGRLPDDCGTSTAPIFDGEQIDLGLAWEFANKRWPMGKKKSALKLSHAEEWIMGMLRDKKTREIHKALKSDAYKTERDLVSKVKSRRLRRRLKDVKGWPIILRARAIAAHIMGLIPFDNDTRVSPSEVARIWSLMTGEVHERRTTGVRIKRLLRHC